MEEWPKEDCCYNAWMEGRRYQQEKARDWLVEQTSGSYIDHDFYGTWNVIKILDSEWKEFMNEELK